MLVGYFQEVMLLFVFLSCISEDDTSKNVVESESGSKAMGMA